MNTRRGDRDNAQDGGLGRGGNVPGVTGTEYANTNLRPGVNNSRGMRTNPLEAVHGGKASSYTGAMDTELGMTNTGMAGGRGAGLSSAGPMGTEYRMTNTGMIGARETGVFSPGQMATEYRMTNTGMDGGRGAGLTFPGPMGTEYGITNTGMTGARGTGISSPGSMGTEYGMTNTGLTGAREIDELSPGLTGTDYGMKHTRLAGSRGTGLSSPGPKDTDYRMPNTGMAGARGAGLPNPGPMGTDYGKPNTGITGAREIGLSSPGPKDTDYKMPNTGMAGARGAGLPYPGPMGTDYGKPNTGITGAREVGLPSLDPMGTDNEMFNTGMAVTRGAGVPYPSPMSTDYEMPNTAMAGAKRGGVPSSGPMGTDYGHLKQPEFGASGCDSGLGTDTEFEKQFKEIKRLLNCVESKYILNQVKGEDIAIFIGNTKSGKSTLINYAIGNQLVAVKMDDFPFTMTIVKANEKERGPVISLEPVSETTFPSIWSATKSGLKGKVVDAPGFEDNRGEAQDIANTFYIKEIIRNAKSVKFVLNTDLNDILSQNINNFTNFMDKMHRIFPETRVLHGGIALVFSKGSEFSSSNICSFFKKNILNQAEMHVEKSLIQYFVDHEECIAFFEMPKTEGLINKANVAEDGIMDVIANKIIGIPGKALTNVQSGVSDKSKVFLLQSQAELCNQGQYFDLLQTVKDAFSKMTIDIYKSETTEDVNQIDKHLLSMYNFVLSLGPPSGGKSAMTDIVNKLSALCNACGIQNEMDESNIAIQVQFVEFLDEILRLKNGAIYIAKFQSTLETIKKEIYEGRILAATKLKKITEEEAEKQRRDLTEKHNLDMEKLLHIINTHTQANKASVDDQLKNLGVLDMIVLTGKKIIHKYFPGL